ncbi:unnamed protein product [Rotaria magnacalcarata]|uniref:Pentatricopeptide repeat-containing protein n=2 Tax=Rotaria magnacalcarata TaxID=392030 RepID=A0A816QSR2_9BILA|nr:unnamed protein product [Rotaria magnacalcarata]
MYRSMMTGYIRNNQAKKAIDLFSEINNPDRVIINLLFNACAQLGTAKELSLVKKVSLNIPKSFHSDPFIQTSLIDALMKCGDTLAAQSLFDTIKTRNLFIYGAMMKELLDLNNPMTTDEWIGFIKIPIELDAAITRYAVDDGVDTLAYNMFIETWTSNVSYEMFFNACEVKQCTYTYHYRFDILEFLTLFLSIFSGRSLAWHFLVPHLV